MLSVVIAEKPSVARSIAAVLKANIKKDGYLEGAGYAVTWAFGHLITLCEPDHYGWVKWNRESLPMVPQNFNLQVAHRYDPATKESKIDPGVSKQLDVIKDLFTRADELIVATDAGREGELIFRYIYEYLNIRKPFKRLWISSLTDKAIQDGFKALQQGQQYDNLYYAAKGRSEADWLVGMNATRALSIAAGQSLFSIGRVQTPTLAILCRRFLENKNFVPEAYYILKLDLEKDRQHFFAYGIKNYEQKEKAEAALQQALTVEKATVLSVEQKEASDPPPLLYDLTTLQQEANKKFSISADDTLKAAQSLYERTYITYPRTGSRYIGEDVFAGIPALIKQVTHYPRYAAAAGNMPVKLNKRSVNGAKVTDHHAILITENIPGELSGHEEKIYELIISRILEAFHESSLADKTVVKLHSGGILFKATGSVLKREGWRSVRGPEKLEDTQEEKSGEEEPENARLPQLVQGDLVARTGAQSVEKWTKPKPIHTEASLLKTMETAGKEIEDEALREAIKACGLGTPATRANVIETLIRRQYIERQKKKLVPTDKGMATYEVVKDKPVASAIMTGDWEKKLSDIAEGAYAYPDFMKEITHYVAEVTNELLASGGNLSGVGALVANADKPICPKCKKGHIRKGEKNYWCTAYKDGCDFKIWLEKSGRKLTDNMVKQLLTKGKTSLLKGFKSKAGNPFDAFLKLDDACKVVFEFEQKDLTTTAANGNEKA
jgi:DNA topoisomerase III